jgi:hypothetical protein
MHLLLKAKRFVAMAAYCSLGIVLLVPLQAHAARNLAQAPELPGDASRMVFKENLKNKKEPSCQLTLMHVYTSKFNKKFTQFAFTGSVVAKRESGKPMVLSVIGQNYQLAPASKNIQPFSIPRIELGVEDVSVRHFTEHKVACKKSSVCAEYKDSKKHELQTWISDSGKHISLLFPLANKQPTVVIDLSKFGPSGKVIDPPLTQFKACAANLR